MSEEKKQTESEIIREQATKAIKWCDSAVLDNEERDRPAVDALREMLSTIHEANESRDKSRKLSFDVTAYDFTEPLVRTLLSQGFDLAVRACVGQLKTVEKRGNVMAWVPPVNPFCGRVTLASEAKPDRTTSAWGASNVLCKDCGSGVRYVPDNQSAGWPGTADVVAFCMNEACKNHAGTEQFDQDPHPSWVSEKA